MTHRDKKPYQCTVAGCSKSYCDARSLRRHLENHHQHNAEQIAAEMVKAQSTAAEVLAEVAQIPPQPSTSANNKSSTDSNSSANPETSTGVKLSSNSSQTNVHVAKSQHYVSVTVGNGSVVTGNAVTSPQPQHSQLFQYDIMVQQQKQKQQQNEQQQQKLKQQQEIQQREQRQKQDQQDHKVKHGRKFSGLFPGDFLPFSRGGISAPFLIENSDLFSHYHIEKVKIFFLLFLETTTTYKKQ